MQAYYNEWEPYAAQWIRNLAAAGHLTGGTVDERSITDVEPDDLRGFERVHFFAGIGGWDGALNLAGWAGPVWSASLPCQPFSVAGSGKGAEDERHLWPAFYGLVRECRPATIVGEQVPAAIRHGWIDRVQADLEAEGYAFGFVVLGAHSVGAPNIRQRIYWVAYAEHAERRAECEVNEDAYGRDGFGRGGNTGKVVQSDGGRRQAWRSAAEADGYRSAAESTGGASGVGNAESNEQRRYSLPGIEREGISPGGPGGASGVGNADEPGSQGRRIGPDEHADLVPARTTGDTGFWSRYQVIQCLDGKARRIGQSIQRVADGLSGSVEQVRAIWPLEVGEENRAHKLRGYGNAINLQLAAEFIRILKGVM